MFNFEKLGVWQKSVVLAELVYRQTKSFPLDERFGLTNQMRRAALSITSNLAEGCSRHSKSDFRRFVEMATGSTFELVAQARIARQQKFLAAAEHDRLYDAALEIVRMLTGLRDSLRD
jgi:four helix bundle protein